MTAPAPAPPSHGDRAARGLLLALVAVGSLWALEIQNELPGAFFREQYLGLFLGLALGAVFLSVGARAGGRPDRQLGDLAGPVPWFDWVLAGAGLLVGFWVAVSYPRVAYSLGVLTWDKVLLGALAVLLVLEAARRLVGWALVWIAVACLLYAKFAWLLPGMLYAKGSSWPRLVQYVYLDANGLFGLPLAVTAGVVVAFIVFGQMLYVVGGDRFLTDVALVAMGRFRGGPAKVAVASSTLFGTVSGSAVANVVVDGAITIPMMKRAGYPPHLAAAIEAVASNGGQIMPPVMGAAAFLIAEYLAIPYREVALAALLPALLYYLALLCQVDLEAARLGLVGVPRAELPPGREVWRRGGVFVIPLAVLLWTLMLRGWSPGRAGMAAALTTLAVGMCSPRTRPTLGGLVRGLEAAGRTLLDLVAITALAGIVIGAFQLSGFTAKLPLLLTAVAGGHTLLLLVLTALVSILLGMSLPTTVVYVTLAVLVAPALVALGIAPLAAHLFLFYFGMLSLITPPDCLATYAAAAIAKADFWRTGWTGMRLGLVAYLVPFAFVFEPALIGRGSLWAIALVALAASAAVGLLAIGCVGYLFAPLGAVRRLAALAAGGLLLVSPTGPLGPGPAALGLAGGFLLVGLEWARMSRAGAARQRKMGREQA